MSWMRISDSTNAVSIECSRCIGEEHEVIRRAAATLADSLRYDPIYLHYFGDSDVGRAALQSFMQDEVRARAQHGLVVVGVGIAIWGKPPNPLMSLNQASEETLELLGLLPEVTRAEWGELAHFEEGVGDGCAYLSAIGVATSLRRRGYGHRVLDVGLRYFDSLGISVRLETAVPKTATWFEKQGFVRRGRYRLADIEVVTMERPWAGSVDPHAPPGESGQQVLCC